ncbi:hypothetical protein D0Y65_039821 [Glycine soja]|uniref:Uncharacterized protein n=1 Tax=Glycine soja TaxID=3848 RepID=A0A445GNI4_GLYSO|nr:hypothetical protein D0Y65_039821 [Glycine soja]
MCVPKQEHAFPQNSISLNFILSLLLLLQCPNLESLRVTRKPKKARNFNTCRKRNLKTINFPKQEILGFAHTGPNESAQSSEAPAHWEMVLQGIRQMRSSADEHQPVAREKAADTVPSKV